MSEKISPNGDRLATVVRLHELELEDARVQLATAAAKLEEQKRRCAEIQQRIDQSAALAQEHVHSEGGVSAETLRQVGSYTKWQRQLLAEQQLRVQEATIAVDQARAEVTQRFRKLSAIERLRERRARSAILGAERSAQKKLDEHALVRAAAGMSHPL
jgi:flagellar export protein FliJ